MPTEIIVSVKTSGGDYTLLKNAEAGEERDLPLLDERSIIEVYPMLDTQFNMAFSGWTTDDTRYPIVRTPSSDSHSGVWSDSVWRWSHSFDSISLTGIRNIYLIGMQFDQQQNYSAGKKTIRTGGNISGQKTHILKCIIKGSNGTNWHTAIDAQWGPVVYVNNCLIYDYYGFSVLASGSTCNIQAMNNTVINCSRGLQRSNGNIQARNNLAFACTDGYVGAIQAGSTNNAYDEGSDPASNGLDLSGYAGGDVFADYAGKDFHLKPGSPCIGQGADLSGYWGMEVKEDIEGTPRPQGASYDIGMSEYPVIAGGSMQAGGAQIPKSRMDYYRNLLTR